MTHPAAAIAGLITVASDFDAAETLSRLDAAVRAAGMTVFAQIDHAAGAREVGLELRATAVLLFGNPKVGTKLMQAAQTLGLDLPLKALVWQDEANRVWLSYDAPLFLAQRHGVAEQVGAVITAMTGALERVVEQATRRQQPVDAK